MMMMQGKKEAEEIMDQLKVEIYGDICKEVDHVRFGIRLLLRKEKNDDDENNKGSVISRETYWRDTKNIKRL
ncbi:hypothetical protein Glove_271g49 [Diversispora epigaea]|uniref:Uncharacterized protein n=1 Tax=Diversispora epigaea TaxID=1348612 RepID=A0A397IAM9_9GLOM|nr:hypothetical protein Glove_271g49 [Diversispora epigaea]